MIKRINHRHYISSAVLMLLVLWSCFFCRDSYIRLFYSVIDFFLGIFYSVFYSFDWCPIPDVNVIKGINVVSHFPKTWLDFTADFDYFVELFFDLDNFFCYLTYRIPVWNFISQLLLYGLLIWATIYGVSLFKKPVQNTDHGKLTKGVERYLKFKFKVVYPTKAYLASLYSFFRARKYYWLTFSIVFLCSCNAASILVSFFAYYFYLLGSLNVTTIFYQVYKLSVDLIIMLDTLPLIIWLVIGAVVFDKLTIHFAYQRLNAQERHNDRFLDKLGVVVFITGVMRAGKTMLMTLLSVLQAKRLRRMSKKKMLKVHTHFPYFPYPVFQQTLLKGFKERKIKSLAFIEEYLAKKKELFIKSPESKNIYGYDIEHYPLSYDDGLVVRDIWEDLQIYAEAFMVYTEPTYFVSTYSVRDHMMLETVGNMPRWDMDLFKRPSYAGGGEFSHILNHDMIRPGKKMEPDKKVFGAIEYGVICLDELDKERENTLELKEVKATSDECNQKNDFVNQYFKMIGHGSMIDFDCFIKAFGTSQRVSSWGADGRELSTVVSVESVSEERLTLRFFNWRLMLYVLLNKLHDDKTDSGWFNRGDTPLSLYLLWELTTWYLNYVERKINTFGYVVDEVAVQDGKLEGEKEMYKIYVQHKAIRAGMYSTASFCSYFRENNKIANIAMEDIPRFKTVSPSLKELSEGTNSHMMNKFNQQCNYAGKE